MLEASPTMEQTCPLLPLAPTLRWVPFLLGHCPPCQPLLPAGPERPVSTPASLPHRARVAPRVPSHRSQGQERCSCQDFCEERTLLWARSHHPATLTQSECAAHGFQTACDFWRKLWQVTSLPGLPHPRPPQLPRTTQPFSVCIIPWCDTSVWVIIPTAKPRQSSCGPSITQPPQTFRTQAQRACPVSQPPRMDSLQDPPSRISGPHLNAAPFARHREPRRQPSGEMRHMS